MTPKDSTPYLFSKSGMAALHGFIDQKTLFAFDLDGTLAPIVENPGDILVPEAILAELTVLHQKAVVAVITGRSRRDAIFHLGFVPQYLVGNHGAEGLPGLETQEDEFLRTAETWETQLRSMLSDVDRYAFFIENKGSTISIHYRVNHNKNGIRTLILSAIDRLVPPPRRIGGKCIFNLIPDKAPDKGAAMLHLMRHTGCPKGFFVGDDETDEDVFRLSGAQLFTVRVGTGNQTKARYVLRNQTEISRLLHEINRFRTER
jgi:trehalose 6-phosphate phosphatase